MTRFTDHSQEAEVSAHGEGNPAQTEAALPDEATAVSRRTVLKEAVVGGAAMLGGLSVKSSAEASAPYRSHGARRQDTPPVREYWIQANSFLHNIVPNGFDGMLGRSFTRADTTYWAIGYQAYTPNWGALLRGNATIGPNTGIPGPILRGRVGEVLKVHFRNNDTHYRFPHSMHPHGVKYDPNSDGSWLFIDAHRPGSAIRFGSTYTYTWTVLPGSLGTWVYHDHSVPQYLNPLSINPELNAELGMYGFLVLTDDSTPHVDQEFFTFFIDLYMDDINVAGVQELVQDFDTFNGHSFVNNTPTFHARVGNRVRWHVGALGREFHVFHLHGHRWVVDGVPTDTAPLGSAVATHFDFVEDNPGTWKYHCHVPDHMMGGMMGFYIVDDSRARNEDRSRGEDRERALAIGI